jgi:hypothetical protein
MIMLDVYINLKSTKYKTFAQNQVYTCYKVYLKFNNTKLKYFLPFILTKNNYIKRQNISHH